VGLYVEYHQLYVDFDTQLASLSSEFLMEIAADIQRGVYNFAQMQQALADRVTSEEAEELSKVRRRMEMLKAALYYSLGERLGMHRHVLGVRSGGRVVRSIASR
jgi:hypothetical protein